MYHNPFPWGWHPLAYCVPHYFCLVYCVQPCFGLAYCVSFNNKTIIFGNFIYKKKIKWQYVACTCTIIFANVKFGSQTIGPMDIWSHAIFARLDIWSHAIFARLDIWSHLVLPDWTFGPIRFLTRRTIGPITFHPISVYILIYLFNYCTIYLS